MASRNILPATVRVQLAFVGRGRVRSNNVIEDKSGARAGTAVVSDSTRSQSPRDVCAVQRTGSLPAPPALGSGPDVSPPRYWNR